MATAAPTTPPRWSSFLPGAWQIRHYRRPWLRGDLIAGLAVAAYLVPQVMAYAELAGLSAVQGLWAAAGPLLLYALFGSSRNLSVGPESTTALMTATALAPLIEWQRELLRIAPNDEHPWNGSLLVEALVTKGARCWAAAAAAAPRTAGHSIHSAR